MSVFSPLRSTVIDFVPSFGKGRVIVIVIHHGWLCEIRFTAERRASEHVHLTVDAQLIFVTKVNFVLKRFIESSARSMCMHLSRWTVLSMVWRYDG